MSLHCVLLWTVNVAARAEQTAMPQTIQISSATVGLLPQDVGLELTPTGGVAMKVGPVVQKLHNAQTYMNMCVEYVCVFEIEPARLWAWSCNQQGGCPKTWGRLDKLCMTLITGTLLCVD
eukprot:1156195-Pelagomonas_calceolata.AAC.6